MRNVVHISDRVSRLAGGLFSSVPGMCRGLSTTRRWRPTTVGQDDEFARADAAVWGDTERVLVAGSGLNAAGRGFILPVEARSPDILHLQSIWGPASQGAWWLTRRDTKKPLVISPRGTLEPWALNNSRWKKKLAWAVWNGSLLHRANCIHALCEEEAHSIMAVLPRAKVCVIPNGVDLPDRAAALQIAPKGKVMLFLGRIHPKKGLDPLIEAWARVPAMSADGWRLVIAGWDDGGHEAALRLLVQSLGLGDSVSFIGPVAGAAKDALLKSASAFVLPSFSEGMPMAVLEAWSYGLPVLMTDECHLGVGFIAGAARRIEPNPASIAEGLADFAARDTRDELASTGACGQALVGDRFSWARIGEDMASVYDWLLGDRKPTCVVN